LGDLFEVDDWVYGQNKQYQKVRDTPDQDSTAIISGITERNGVSYYTNDKLEYDELFSQELTISTRGIYSGTVFYHSETFALANNILVMRMPDLTKNHKLFIGAAINGLPYGGYDNYPRRDTLKEDVLHLPTCNGAIDFGFMESFIAELEAARIAKLEAYLAATGLKDYTLTPKEQAALDALDRIKWGEFRLEELFNIATGRDIIIGRTASGCTPLISHQHKNNGISKKIRLLPDRCVFNFESTLSLADRGVFLASTQNENFHIGTRVKALSFKSGRKSLQARLFFTSCINKLQILFTTYESNATDSLPDLTINLPSLNGVPDYAYMETLITAVQKLVIAGVVDYADRRIAAYQQVTGVMGSR